MVTHALECPCLTMAISFTIFNIIWICLTKNLLKRRGFKLSWKVLWVWLTCETQEFHPVPVSSTYFQHGWLVLFPVNNVHTLSSPDSHSCQSLACSPIPSTNHLQLNQVWTVLLLLSETCILHSCDFLEDRNGQVNSKTPTGNLSPRTEIHKQKQRKPGQDVQDADWLGDRPWHWTWQACVFFEFAWKCLCGLSSHVKQTQA